MGRQDVLRLCRATVDDAEKWVELNRAFMDEEVEDAELWNHINEGEEESDRLAKVFKEALENPELISLFMIKYKDEVVGFANLMTIYSVWAHGKAVILDDLFIQPAARRCGLGRKVMEELARWAAAQGYKRLQFQSEETNPDAKAFYQAIGYRPAAMNFYVKYLGEQDGR